MSNRRLITVVLPEHICTKLNSLSDLLEKHRDEVITDLIEIAEPEDLLRLKIMVIRFENNC